MDSYVIPFQNTCKHFFTNKPLFAKNYFPVLFSVSLASFKHSVWVEDKIPHPQYQSYFTAILPSASK